MKHLTLLLFVSLTITSCTFTPTPMDERYCLAQKVGKKTNPHAYNACMAKIKRDKEEQPGFVEAVIEELVRVIIEN